jgi:hypothetical protein
MRPIPLLAAANGVGDPAAHPRGGAPNAGDWERECGDRQKLKVKILIIEIKNCNLEGESEVICAA